MGSDTGLLNPKPKHALHSRVARLLIAGVVFGSIAYSFIVWLTVDRLEQALLTTLVGHEVDEIVQELAANVPQVALHRTAAFQSYLRSHDPSNPVPDYIKALAPGIHHAVPEGDRIYQVAVIDSHDDRIYLAFDITHLEHHGDILLMVLVASVVVTAIVVILVGIWFSRRFLLPVSQLAEEVARIDPNQRNVRIEEGYRGYEVGLIAHSIDQFLHRMDDFVEREQSFTSAVSHELRTPVSVIATAAELLELDRDVSKKQMRAIGRIQSSTEHMSEIIESLLFFARGGQRNDDTDPARARVQAVIDEVLAEYRPGAEQKGLELQTRIDAEVSVRVPRSHLAIIIGNLVQNAVRYTDQGAVTVVLNTDGVTVADTGRGLSEREIEQIHNRSYQGPNSVGCGLGLNLVIRMCDHYGLQLDIQSEPGRGSRFTIRFA